MSKEILALNWVNLIFTFWPIRKKNSGNFLLFSKFGKIFDIESIAKITSRKICSVGWFAQIGWFFHAKISPYKVDASFFSLTWSLTGKQETLREKCPNTEFFLVLIFLYSDQKKLRIWTLSRSEEGGRTYMRKVAKVKIIEIVLK